MRNNTRFRIWLFAVAAALLAYAAPAPEPALAAKKTYEDKKLGFKIRIEDSFTQNPPKTTADESYLVGDWYEDAAKFDSGYLRPTFQVYWFVEPKTAPPTTAEKPESGGSSSEEDERKSWREAMKAQSFDDALDRLLQYNEDLFGTHVPMADRWKDAEKGKSVGKIPMESFELNPPSKRKPEKGEKEIRGYGYVARLTLERPNERIHVGFFASCSVAYVKRFRPEFAQTARSFEELRSATDSRNEGAQAELSKDPKLKREQVRKTKVIAGWKCVDTENYILLHHVEVSPDLARAIGSQIEAIRAQIYEVLFPPDRPIIDVCIIRVCKDRAQYIQYGGSPSSAGYWSSYHEELVFYEDDSKKDSLSVLYHEAFHQYIHYSVGEFAPHSWFNEGHGDYFAGHKYVGGKFVRDVFSWRVDTAREWKKNPKRPPLREWVGWDQGQYYGSNKAGIDGLANYALGWSLVYFLRTTKKPEYQGVLDRYFKSLKGSLTRARQAEEDFEKKLKEWEEKVKTDPEAPRPERDGATSDRGSAEQWLDQANKDAFSGIDWDAIEKDWLNAPY